jgi:lipopolysaccharide transport system permease protein/teichoic acid transport system permease protein
MAKREVAKQYVGSLLGFIWTFIQPLVLILVLWVVFSLGFRVRPTQNVPFVVWLTAGMAPWFAFSEMITGSAQIVVANAHLVKKTVFQSQILPVIKIVAALITHTIFLTILILLILINKVPITIYYLQFLYYLSCLAFLALGIGWLVSCLNVFVRDVAQIVGVIVQIGFWATPIFWDINIMPERLQPYIKLNPMFYIVQGYRESFLYGIGFWHHPLQTLWFWFFSGAMFVFGALVFQKLKPQFADVL